MYFDNSPCRVCGADVELRARRAGDAPQRPDPDGTVDQRVCTNPDCETNTRTGEDAPQP